MLKSSLKSIQALRAVAAIMVVICHIAQQLGSAIGIGSYGVDIFFVISGFIIAYVSDGDASDFLAKRIFRVVPIYWLGTIGIFLIASAAPALLAHTSASPIALVKSLFFVPFLKWGNTIEPILYQGWTLNYELLFYSLFAIALWILPQRAWLCTVGLLIVLVVAGAAVSFKAVPLRFWTNPIILEFAFGMLLYKARLTFPVAFRVVPMWAIILGLALSFAILIFPYTSLPLARPIIYGLPAFAIVGLGLACEGRVAIPRLLVGIGDASYSLYLFHPYIMVLIYKSFARFIPRPAFEILLAPIVLVICIAGARWLYTYVEKPLNQWLRKTFLAPRRLETAGSAG